MFKKLAKSLLGEKKSPIQASGFDFPDGVLLTPPQAYIPGHGRLGEANVTFEDTHQLGLMTIEVEVYRQGNVHSQIVEMPRTHSAALRRHGYEDSAHIAKGYSFEEFLRVFDQRLDENPERDPTQMKYGKVGYFTNKGDHKEVGSQKSFEKAIDHLFTNTGSSDVLKFIFQPEHYEKMNARHAAEQVILDKIAAERAIEEIREQQKEMERIAKETFDELLAEEALEAKLAEKSARSSPKSSPKPEEFVETSESILEHETPVKKDSPVLVVKKAIEKVTKKVAAKPETKEEEYERLTGLIQEESRKSFKKGGDKVGQHLVARSFIQRAGDETDAEEDEDEEDDGISQEDRIAAR
jgi:hypothetical protein